MNFSAGLGVTRLPACPVSDQPTFAVVIPTSNEEGNLGRLLASIRLQVDSSYSIAIVDQGSTDGTVEIAQSYSCTVIQTGRPLFYTPPARSRNIGAASIDGRILLHLDADMELTSPTFLSQLTNLIDTNHRAAVIHELDVPAGFWATCKALERSCYWGTQLESARAVTRELFARVGGYDEAISAGEDFFIARLYERETQIATNHKLFLRHHIGYSSLGSLLRKKWLYGRTSGRYLERAGKVGALTGTSIVTSSALAYLKNWRLLGQQPVHYTCIVPLRLLEFGALQLGMWFAPQSAPSPTDSLSEP